jgi:hypothetical protein
MTDADPDASADPDALVATTAASGEVSDDALRVLWSAIGVSDDELDYVAFEDAFLAQVQEGETTSLAFRPGGWVVKASSTLVKTALTTALLAVGLVSIGAAGIPLLVLPAVLPLIVDVDRVQLSAGEHHLLATLTLTDEARHGTAEVLYGRLPEALQEQVNEMAFRDFLEKCQRAGLADTTRPADGGATTFALHAADQSKFRVTFI